MFGPIINKIYTAILKSYYVLFLKSYQNLNKQKLIFDSLINSIQNEQLMDFIF